MGGARAIRVATEAGSAVRFAPSSSRGCCVTSGSVTWPFGEVHGNPTRVGYVPIVGDPKERELFEQKIANIGANTGMSVPRGVDGHDGMGYDYKLVEARV